MRSKRGFTLIELLVVIAIIGLLASIILASLNTARSKSRDARRLEDMRTIQTALELYASNNNGYPNTGSNPSGSVDNWVYSLGTQPWIPGLTSAYVSSVPLDPENISPSGGPELVYYYNSDGPDYCIQISQENSCSTSPYYEGVWSGTCKLRVGDNSIGPTGYCSNH